MNPTLRKCLEALSLRQYHSQVPIKLDKVEDAVSTFQPPFMQEQERISQNSTHIPAPVDNTPVVPYVPVKPRECQAFYDMNESMKKYLCNNCDKFGNVKYMGGMTGKCLRYRI